MNLFFLMYDWEHTSSHWLQHSQQHRITTWSYDRAGCCLCTYLSTFHPCDFIWLISNYKVYWAICLWSDGHITCKGVDRNICAFRADSRNGWSSLKKNLHLTKAIQPTEGSSKWDLEFNDDNYAPITDSFALLAVDTFDSVAKMEDYAEEAVTYQASALKKPKSLKAAKEKAVKMTGPATWFLHLPAVRTK